MSEHDDQKEMVEAVWRAFLTGTPHTPLHRQRTLYRFLPGETRCKLCKAPFEGVGASVVKLFFRKQPSNLNPQLCNVCDKFATEHQGGAEVVISMLFADVRGSTSLAEGLSASEFSSLINRFYNEGSRVLIKGDALIDRLVGDQLIGYFVPGFAGPDYAQKAINAAQELLVQTGHSDPDGPWIPVGVGVHVGTAFVGSVGSGKGVTDITALGDAVNIAARLASEAQSGEFVVSEDALSAAAMEDFEGERRALNLKGRIEPVNVRVLGA
jgi:adenylate cyclase